MKASCISWFHLFAVIVREAYKYDAQRMFDHNITPQDILDWIADSSGTGLAEPDQIRQLLADWEDHDTEWAHSLDDYLDELLHQAPQPVFPPTMEQLAVEEILQRLNTAIEKAEGLIDRVMTAHYLHEAVAQASKPRQPDPDRECACAPI